MCLNTNDPSDEASPAATRQVLLEAAVVVFAERGFRAASVREICQRAAVNVAAVNYHFGDKESLYAEALTFALHCAHAKYPADLGLAPGATPAERLYAFVHSFLLRIFDEGRAAWHGKMMSREMIEPTAALDGLVQAEIRPMSEQLSRIIRDLLGRKAGEAEVRRCGMSVVSQCLFYEHCRPVIARLFPDMPFTAEGVERLADHITRFSLAALEQMAREKPSRSRK